MTLLGLYLLRNSINKAELSRKTNISPSRLNELTLNTNSRLRVTELCRIAKAIETDPQVLFKFVCEIE